MIRSAVIQSEFECIYTWEEPRGEFASNLKSSRSSSLVTVSDWDTKKISSDAVRSFPKNIRYRDERWW